MSSPAPSRVGGAPPAPPSLFGRDEARALLDASVAAGGVTVLVGPPGVGKSSLVAALAATRGPVLWVDVSSATTPAELWGAFGAALGLSLESLELAPERVGAVMAATGTRLVVLDAAEHLDAAAWGAVERLVRDVPDVAWAVTSVVRPDTRARVLELGPLAEADAVALLVARAQERELDAPVDARDPAWCALAERLSGLPLALELAAGRFGVLTPGQILERLDRPRLLTGGRHGSVDGALRYAWELLGDADRAALAGCSVFRGGFDVAAAEAVLGDDALERITSLRARSALAWRDGRFHVLDGLRRIAEVEAPDHLADARARHAAWYGARAEALHEAIRGPDPASAVAALQRERRNVDAAWSWARGADPELAAQLACSIVTSVALHGPLWGADHLGDVPALARSVGGWRGARLLSQWGHLCCHRARVDLAQPVLEEALAEAERHGDTRARMTALVWLAEIPSRVGDIDTARARAARAQAAAVDAVQRGLAWAILGVVEGRAGDPAAAAAAFERALVELEGTGAVHALANARGNLGILRVMQRRFTEARALLEQCAPVLADIQRSTALALQVDLVALHILRGELGDAHAALRAAEALQRTLGRPGYDASLIAYGAILHWAAGARGAARETYARALPLPHASSAARGATRAMLAVLEAGPGLRDELDAARAEGCYPQLQAVLDAWAAREPLPPPPPVEATLAQIARLLLAGSTSAWQVDGDGRWFERPGGRVDLSRRGAMRRILAALVAARRERPGVGLTVDDLFDAGWPGEKVQAEAAASRVYTAVRELRALGLEPVLQRHAEGYLLDPAVDLAVR